MTVVLQMSSLPQVARKVQPNDPPEHSALVKVNSRSVQPIAGGSKGAKSTPSKSQSRSWYSVMHDFPLPLNRKARVEWTKAMRRIKNQSRAYTTRPSSTWVNDIGEERLLNLAESKRKRVLKVHQDSLARDNMGWRGWLPWKVLPVQRLTLKVNQLRDYRGYVPS